MTIATTTRAGQKVALDRIRVPQNVRELDEQHVDALAGSIELRGLLVPVIVRPDGEGFQLVAGFHRLAAHHKLGLGEIEVEVREAEEEHADRAVENIARKQLGALEEALAVKAMLEQGLTEDGAAQALGWPKARVTARVKLLELPERAQQLVGAGVIALSAVDSLRAIGQVSRELLETLTEYLDNGNEWAAERLVSEPGWVLGQALREAGGKVFAAYLNQTSPAEVAELRLGKKTEELLAEAEKLHKQLTPYAYGPPPVRFTEADVDQARAAGVLIEFERGLPIVVDRALYRSLARGAVERCVEQLREMAAAAEQQKAAGRAAGKPADPVAEARREHGRALRELAAQAHGVNLDLGAALLNGLSSVDPSDMDVARFFVYALLGSDYTGSGYAQHGERIAKLAVSGIRLVIDEFRSDVTKTRKDGSRGALRIDYGDPREPEQPIAWLWKFIDGAKTAGELYGRALVVIAAEQHAWRLVVPASQQTDPTRWASRKGLAAKALGKLAGPHLPASLKALERAVKRAHDAHAKAERDAYGRVEAARKEAQQHNVDEAPAGESLAVDADEHEYVEDVPVEDERASAPGA